ncbi:GlxA family transcriptional regulator [Streptomyces lonarensis]|uniref:Helix-turn-helix domain-containing protein n=1 Tax=Streptomyces lonarensis TaxID=700599 RepID=A0A7X6CXK2_9ACTN|nr:DJ-1/PfpI family protein [Streptomyces lonarensis]NJQ04434.1 helix-turn-helix domain-containing protein [Streptomyces lonarensis]
MDTRRVVFVIFEGFQALDLLGPYEVFEQARRHGGGYRCEIAARRPGPVRSSGGVVIDAERGLAAVPTAEVDTLVLAGGEGVDEARHDAELTAWIAACADSRRVASVCSGVFLLGAAGLLAGRRVTTHWGRADQLAREHPEATVDRDPVHIRDGSVWTSAGVTAGMDLALALVEDDMGRDTAHAIARELVLFLRRPGTQSQFSVPLWSAQPATEPIRAAVAAVHTDPGARHTAEELARRAGLSPRHLQRRFTAELGVPPGEYVETARVEAAKRALVAGEEPVATVARRCGFGTAETLRRTFHRRVGVSPSDYRDRFRTSGERAAR